MARAALSAGAAGAAGGGCGGAGNAPDARSTCDDGAVGRPAGAAPGAESILVLMMTPDLGIFPKCHSAFQCTRLVS